MRGRVTRLLQILYALPPWILWAAVAAGVLLFTRAFKYWQLSWSGSGYKGITGVYWASLFLQVINAALLLTLGVLGLVAR